MKLHWGAGLVLAFIVFAAAILTMVAISMNREVDLVSDDYYERELQHQTQIDDATRSNALPEQPQIGVVADRVTLTLPKQFASGTTTGTVHFYRPSDRKRDFVLPLQLDSLNTQTVRTSALAPGLWRVILRWKRGEEQYAREEPIMIR